MPQSHLPAIRWLRLAMLAAVVLPCIVFAYASTHYYRHLAAVADERIERTLNVLHEHALKVFETIDRSIAETNEIVRGMSDEQILAEQERLHWRLRRLVDSTPQFKSMWIFDRNGRSLVNSLIYPQPPLSFADRDYFAAHVERNIGTYVGEILRPREPYPPGNFFSVSRRRPSPDGSFTGIIQISMLPEYFQQFYLRLQEPYSRSYAALLRADGTVLARYPSAGDRDVRIGPDSPFGHALAAKSERGFITGVSTFDGLERRVAYVKLANMPVYVMAGVETGAITQEWLTTMASHLAFGIPATIAVLAFMGMAMQRTRRLYAESQRRAVAEGALRQAQRMEAIGQLTGGVAHDFNNLLMVIKGNVQRLRREVGEGKAQRQLEMIETAAQRGENLTRQLLSFARRQNLSPVVIDLRERAQEFKNLLAPSLRGDIDVEVEVPDYVCAVKVDPSELELAVINLAVNARDAMPNGGKLSLSVGTVVLNGEPAFDRLRGEFVVLSVADTGTGIVDEVRQRIFEPFFTTKEVGKGTGLGLSQVYGFAKQSGGTVLVSTMLGCGTTFRVYLPRSVEAVTAPHAGQKGEPRGEQKLTVLVVEDNLEVAEVAAGFLEQFGYRVRRATNARAALDVLEERPDVDLVFSDVVMPGGMNGMELAATLRARRPDLPVVLTTGYSEAATAGPPAGVRLLRKPYDPEQLEEALRASLEAKRSTGAALVG